LEPKLLKKAMVGAPEPEPMGCGINSSKETSIQPTTTLRNKLGNSVGYVRFSFGGLSRITDKKKRKTEVGAFVHK
jgi:hypothetical protein